MNYLIVIIISLIVLIILDKYVLHTTPYNIKSDKESSIYEESIGFVKPEHRLLNILNNVSSGSKINLKGTCSKFMYNKNTISKDLNDKLIFVITKIISSINQISKDDFYVKSIENVYGLIDAKKNQRYFIDFFIYDTNNYYTIRLLADIVIIDEEIYINYLNINTGSTNAILNKYDVKFRSAGILFDSDMFHEDILKIFDNHYSSNFNVIGVSDTNLEYNTEDLTSVLTLNSLEQLYFPATKPPNEIKELHSKGLSSYLEMYLPNDQKQKRSSLYCNKEKIVWDKFGIPIKEEDSENCLFNNHINFEVNQPWQGPGDLYKRTSNDAYKWLKDPARSNIYQDKGFNV